MRRDGNRLAPIDTMRLQRRIEAFSIPEPNSGCWIWIGCQSKGYGYLRQGGKMKIASRMSYAAFRCDPGDAQVLHRCDFPPCVNPDHLFLGTIQNNMDDRELKGRTWKKLSNDDVAAIRSSTEKGIDLAIKYGVSGALISIVRNYKFRT